MTIRLSLATLARLALVLGGTALAIVALGPFQWLEFELVPWDKAAHFIAFYSVTSLLFLAFPRGRRLDLAFIATFAGASIEVAQMFCGRDYELGDIVANGCGAFAVVIPGYLEMARQSMRGEARRERRRRAVDRLKDVSPAPAPEPLVELI